jgi:hypothetical protein
MPQKSFPCIEWFAAFRARELIPSHPTASFDFCFTLIVVTLGTVAAFALISVTATVVFMR